MSISLKSFKTNWMKLIKRRLILRMKFLIVKSNLKELLSYLMVLEERRQDGKITLLLLENSWLIWSEIYFSAQGLLLILELSLSHTDKRFKSNGCTNSWNEKLNHHQTSHCRQRLETLLLFETGQCMDFQVMGSQLIMELLLMLREDGL